MVEFKQVNQEAIAIARKLAAEGKDCGVVVKVSAGDPAFVSYWFGPVWAIEAIKRDLNQNPETLDQVCGIFVISLDGYNEPVTDDLGQVELPGGCDFSIEKAWALE